MRIMGLKQKSFETIGQIPREHLRHTYHPLSVVCRLSSRGFTAIELIVIIIAICILSASIIVRNPFGNQDYSSIAADQLIADIQYVQIRAMGTRRQQSIVFSVNESYYTIRDNITDVEQKNLPKDVKIRTTNFSSNILTFNTLGEPIDPSTGLPSVIDGSIGLGDSTSTYQIITVLQITGKAQ
jgi:hypothetical protein